MVNHKLFVKGEKVNIFVSLKLLHNPLDNTYEYVKNSGTIESVKGLDYKQFGTYTRAKERQPNKHEGALTNAKTKTTGAAKGKTSTRNRQTVGSTATTRGN
jgi:hypothetical protein